MHLLDIIAIMGYPTYSHYQEGCYDLFKISNGYEYERSIKYENGGHMKSLHKIKYEGGKLTGDFHVLEASAHDIPELVGIEPIAETYYPAGPGKIRSKLMIAWKTKEGKLFRAECDSEYRLSHKTELPFLQFRLINFKKTDHTSEVLDQAETLNVVRDIAGLF
jgi:hypothetical protein